MTEPIEPADCLEAVKQQGAVEALEDIKYEFVCRKANDQKTHDRYANLSMKDSMRQRIEVWKEVLQIVDKKLSQYPSYKTEGDTTEEGTE